MKTQPRSNELKSKIQQYVDIVLKVGLNLQLGQRLLIRSVGSNVSAASFVRRVTEDAYRAGASFVDVLWTDEQLDLIRLQHGPLDSLDTYPQWQVDAILEYARQGDAILTVLTTDPDLFAGQDPELTIRLQQTRAKKLKPYFELLSREAFNWLITALPEPRWAKKVFPDLPRDEQMLRLWEAIFDTLRLDQPDPVTVWQDHIDQIITWQEYLTQKQYQALAFSGPGTDLTVGLTDRHLWKGGQGKTQSGILYTPNLPTEEVFTLPHRQRVDGVVRSTKPLSYGGVLIDNFSLTFKGGRVVDVTAGRGESALRKIIQIDEGANRLGEVALVPHSSPVSQSGLLFYKTLFDENAACHLALGAALKSTLEGGTSMTSEAFLVAGGNESVIHIDFMIGSGKIDVDGITAEGTREAVMRAGEWAIKF